MNLAVDGLAAFRLTRLITEDKVTEPARDRIVLHAPPMVGYLVECPWCVGLWAGIAVTAARRLAPRAWAPVASALAVGAIVGIINEHR